MNGAGTGMDLYIAARQAQVCRSVMAAVDAVVLGTTTLTARRLPSGSASARTSATARMASALFAPRSSPICRGSILPERICEKNF